MRVAGVHAFGFVLLQEILVAEEHHRDICVANHLVARGIDGYTDRNLGGAEKGNAIPVFQPGLDSVLNQVSARSRQPLVLFEEAQVDAQNVIRGSSVDELLAGRMAPRLPLRVLGDVVGDGVRSGEVEFGSPPAVEDDGESTVGNLVEAVLELAQVLARVVTGDCRQDCVDGCLAVVVEKIADRSGRLRVSLRQILKAVEDSTY